MIEKEVVYNTAPGSNGETEFYNVMRQMYDATTGAENATAGAALGTIAGSATENFNFTITSLPAYIADKGEVTFAIYIQNNGTKEMMQAGKTVAVPIPGLIDVAAATASVAASGYCDYSFTPGVEFTNNDAAAVTDVVVEYTINGGTAVSESFSGNLAQGQSTTIAFPATTLAGGTSVVSYEVTSVNGAQNWQSPAAITVADESYSKLGTTAVPAPVTEGMETAPLTATGISQDLTTAIFDSPTVGAGSFAVVDGPANNLGAIGGYAASDRSILFQFYAVQSGVMNVVMEKVNLGTNSHLSFDHAYRQYQSENDELDVSVSTDCGATWTSVFTDSGASLMTLPAATAQFFPSAAGDWTTTDLDMSAYDNMSDVVVRFRATSAYGNNLFIDNINLGAPTGVEDITASTFDVYPNPATDVVTVELSEVGSVDAQIEVLDIKGQVVSSEVMSAGQASVQVNTSALASGIYTVRVMSENGVATERVVIK
jgi:archaellum component FlaG (FlaF/FlaG flagellin family)